MRQLAAVQDAYILHYSRLVRLAWALVGTREDAEEVVQEAFLRTIRARPGLFKGKHQELLAYLRAAVVNIARSSHRKKARERDKRSALQRRVLPTSPGRLEESIDLIQAVHQLPLRKRACIVLRYLEDLTEQETADLLGVSLGTVKSQTHKALHALQHMLSEPSASRSNQ